MAAVYERIPAPSYTKGPTYGQDEILYSYTGRFTQNGITIAGGQGVLAAGTVMARKTADKRYYPYDNVNADLSLRTAVGILRQTVDTGTGGGQPDQLGNIVISGILKLDKIVGLDAAALTDLGGTSNTVNNTLKL